MIKKFNIFKESLEFILPTKRLKKVYHVGDIDLNKKSKNSLEGSGLSISLHPEAWKQISETTYGDTHTLLNDNGIFLDYYKLKASQKNEIINWGVDNGYVELKETYRVYYDDGSYVEFEDYEKAKYEAGDEYKLKSNKKGGLIPTEKLRIETHQQKIDILQSFDLLLTVYTEKNTNFDGVWWNDRLDVYENSAPRGVIFNSKLKNWKIIN